MTLSSTRRHLIAWSALALCGLCATVAQAADAYPNKPIKLVVPYPPGGPTDIVARVIAQKMQEEMGQTWIVDNRPGAGANLGAENVARSPADGYSLLVATTAHAINPSLFSNLSYSLKEDFTPVSQLTSGALVIVVNPSLPVKDVKDLIALAQSKQGGLNFATSGNGQSTHLSAEMFNAMAGVKMNHIPYKGSAPALSDLVAGHADLMFDTMLSAMPFIKSGKLKALAVTSAQRSPSAPDLPTIAEAGLPGYEAIAWNGILAPAGTPAEVIETLNVSLKKVLESADVKERFAAQGFTATWNSPADYGQFLDDEITTWAQVVKDSGARVE